MRSKLPPPEGGAPLRGGSTPALWFLIFALLPACQTVGGRAAPPEIPVPPHVEIAVESEDLPPPDLPPAPDLSALNPGGNNLPPDPVLLSPALADPLFGSRVSRWIETWRDEQPHNFQIFMERKRSLSSIVEEEVTRRGLPLSLASLPIVESGYILEVANPSGAGGLWQIMPTTARTLGLEVSNTVDERRDPVASTRAALDYLERHFSDFGSWFLAIAAYNAGSGAVGNLITRAGGRREGESGDELFVRIHESLPGETEDLLARWVAAATLASDPEGHGLPHPESAPWSFDEVVVGDAVSLEVIARAAGVRIADVETLNPQILRGYLQGGASRTVRLPAGTGPRFEAEYPLIPPSERLAFREHVVASGETFSHIAQRHGIPLADLLTANEGVDPRRLRVGTRVRVPTVSSR